MLPYIEEQLFGKKEELAKYALETLKKGLAGPVEIAGPPPPLVGMGTGEDEGSTNVADANS